MEARYEVKTIDHGQEIPVVNFARFEDYGSTTKFVNGLCRKTAQTEGYDTIQRLKNHTTLEGVVENLQNGFKVWAFML